MKSGITILLLLLVVKCHSNIIMYIILHTTLLWLVAMSSLVLISTHFYCDNFDGSVTTLNFTYHTPWFCWLEISLSFPENVLILLWVCVDVFLMLKEKGKATSVVLLKSSLCVCVAVVLWLRVPHDKIISHSSYQTHTHTWAHAHNCFFFMIKLYSQGHLYNTDIHKCHSQNKSSCKSW